LAGVIEPRIYRAAFVPAVLALVLAMFSLESRPAPLPQGLAADVLFDGDLAAGEARSIADAQPDRHPGSVGDRATARRVADVLRRRGFGVEVDRFSGGDRALVNVIGRRAGRSRRQIVVLAARDAPTTPDVPGSAADTAALLELARVFQGRPSRDTLVLASVDGSTLGQLGASELLGSLPDPSLVDGVIAISDLGARTRRGSFIQAWGNDSRRTGIGMQRTVAASIRQELEAPVEATGTLGQLARLAFPIGIGAQGVLLEQGYEAVTISGSGELPPRGTGPEAALDQDRLGGLGRAALRTVSAIDQGGRPEHGPDTYLGAVSKIVPGWVVSLLAIALIVPALVASVDAFARARRRRYSVSAWLRWVALGIAAFVVGLGLAELLTLVGATPDPPPAPTPPADFPLDSAAVVVLVAVTVATAALWYGLTTLVVRRDPNLDSPADPGAGCAVALVLSAAAVGLWLLNPFAALLLVPALHLWTLSVLAAPGPPRRVRLGMVALGLVPPLGVALYYLVSLRLDPLAGAWYLLLLFTGHTVGLASALLACAELGGLAATVAIVLARRDAPARVGVERPPVYGPGAHAGPGALGGTESALRR
jgi:hypothetical protein